MKWFLINLKFLFQLKGILVILGCNLNLRVSSICRILKLVYTSDSEGTIQLYLYDNIEVEIFSLYPFHPYRPLNKL